MALWLSQVAAQAALLFVISGIAVQFSAGAESNGEECKIERRLEDAYVTALYEHYPAMSGCISREQTTARQEIHAVVIRGMMTTSLRTPGMTSGFKNGVDVIIKYNSQRTVGNVNAVFVLVSAVPTIWRIHSEKIFNSSLGHFLVSRHSGIDRERRTKFKMSKVVLPTDPQQLAKWIRKKWSALTTLMVMEIATVITLKVGIDPSAKEKCEIDPYLPNVYASHVEVQETRGCLASRSDGRNGRDVHIIELMSPSVDYVNNTRYDVLLNVRSKTRPVASRHVVLVLKSHVLVHWHIVTHSLRGTLDVITDQSVDSNGTNTHSCRVAVEDLTGYNGSNLISWTSDKYGFPISYTEAQLANQFDLIVDDSDRLESGRSPVSADGESRQSKRNYHDAVANVTNLNLMIIRALLISCDEDSITLTIQKRALRYHNMLPSRLSFSDVSCAARDNGTHYVFSTSKHACGTEVIPSHDAIAYRTAIMVQWDLKSSAMVNRHNTSVSSFGGSDVNPLDNAMINISCDSPLATDAQQEIGLPAISNNIQFQLKLFRDALFRNEILAFPARISNQEIVYVQANIAADDCITVNINSCSLEFDDPSSNEFSEEHPLIVNGCIFDESARWVNVDSEDGLKSQRFEFHFQQFWNISYNTTLQCKLTICAVCPDRIVPGVPLCKVRKHQCGHPDSSSQVAQIVKSISKGPLELLVPSTGTILDALHTTPSSVLSSVHLKTAQGHDIEINSEEMGGVDGRHTCEQIIRLEGLSTEIVVSIAFTAFIIGILLMASLWCIYVRTGPTKMKAKAGMRSISNSGDSTPSSTAPMTIHPANTHRR